MKYSLHSTLAAALCAALAWPALAQTPAASIPAAAECGMRYDAQAARMPAAEMPARWRDAVAQFKQKLHLTPAQEAAWTQYQEAMHAPQHARLGMPEDSKTLQSLTTPERIDRMRALREQRAAAMDKHGEATKAFYAQLDSAQQKTFDSQMQHMMGRMHDQHQRRHGKHEGPRHFKSQQPPASPMMAPQ